jgi:hypothetical protein
MGRLESNTRTYRHTQSMIALYCLGNNNKKKKKKRETVETSTDYDHPKARNY